MKIDLDKSAFPRGPSDYDRGMTVREEAWLRFAAAAMELTFGEKSEDYTWDMRASDACVTADKMIAAIEAREGEGD